MYLVIYVDDMLLVGNDKTKIMKIVEKLSTEFKMKDLKEVSRFMGLNVKIDRSKKTISIDQSHYSLKILEKFNMIECNTIKTPIEQNLKLERGDSSDSELPYRELIGILMFLCMGSRPDLSFAVNYFSRFQEGANINHWNHLKRTLRYIRGTVDLKLVFNENVNAPPVSTYVDADFGTDEFDRKSTSGYIVNAFGCPVMWSSKKQTVVALSSTEAEFVAATAATCETIWFRKVFDDLEMPINSPTPVYEDNQGAICMSRNPETKRTKHIDIKYYFITDCVEQKKISMLYVPTEIQLADILTKALPRDRFEKLRDLILSRSVNVLM